MNWISSKPKREQLAFIGAGLATIAAGAWAVFVYFQPAAIKVQTVYNICAAGDGWQCPKGSIVVGCTGSQAAAAKLCVDLAASLRQTSQKSGGKCGVTTFEVTCEASTR